MQAMRTRSTHRTAAALVAGILASVGLANLPVLAATQLTGAGSTFVYPFFSKAFYAYSQQHGDVNVNYQSIGSGGGIQQFTAKTVDFGASDVPMNADELKRAGGPVVQIPVALGGEAITYNLPVSIPGGLRLSARRSSTSISEKSPTGTTRRSKSSIRAHSFPASRSSPCIAPTDRERHTSSPTFSAASRKSGRTRSAPARACSGSARTPSAGRATKALPARCGRRRAQSGTSSWLTPSRTR